MNILARQSDVGRGEKAALIGNSFSPLAVFCGLAALLRRVVFVGGTYPPGSGQWRGRCSNLMARKADGEKASQNEEFPVSPGYISMARFVFRHDEALAQSVMNGAESLNAAYETAKKLLRSGTRGRRPS
ncbi:hypothetical protein ACCT05_14970 [Rhizobium ruizarguesonis]